MSSTLLCDHQKYPLSLQHIFLVVLGNQDNISHSSRSGKSAGVAFIDKVISIGIDEAESSSFNFVGILALLCSLHFLLMEMRWAKFDHPFPLSFSAAPGNLIAVTF